MTIKPAEIYGFGPARLEMFYGEKRRDREVSWRLGFQVWLQLLTHLLAAEGATTLVVDEPEISVTPTCSAASSSCCGARTGRWF
ncbi:hypothetical protein AB5I41_10345 [Sphingomonas sp. MMS24-JH45]